MSNIFKNTARRKRVDNIHYNLNVAFLIIVILGIRSMLSIIKNGSF